MIHLIEPFPSDSSDPVANYLAIRKELDLYSRELTNKPEVIAISKAELTDSEEIRKKLQQETGKEVMAVSAATGQGLSILVNYVMKVLKETEPEPVEKPRPNIPFPEMPAAQVGAEAL